MKKLKEMLKISYLNYCKDDGADPFEALLSLYHLFPMNKKGRLNPGDFGLKSDYSQFEVSFRWLKNQMGSSFYEEKPKILYTPIFQDLDQKIGKEFTR